MASEALAHRVEVADLEGDQGPSSAAEAMLVRPGRLPCQAVDATLDPQEASFQRLFECF